MDELEKIAALKKRVENQQRRADRAQGALETLKAQLKKEFGCTSLADARSQIERLQEQEEILEDNLKIKTEAFQEKYGDLLQ